MPRSGAILRESAVFIAPRYVRDATTMLNRSRSRGLVNLVGRLVFDEASIRFPCGVTRDTNNKERSVNTDF
jgi:hypothetical protein